MLPSCRDVCCDVDFVPGGAGKVSGTDVKNDKDAERSARLWPLDFTHGIKGRKKAGEGGRDTWE